MIAPEAVIDCSALVRTLTDHGPAGHAVRRRLAGLAGLAALAAPRLLDYEMLSALLGMARARRISEQEAEKAVDDYRLLPLVRHETPVLSRSGRSFANLT